MKGIKTILRSAPACFQKESCIIYNFYLYQKKHPKVFTESRVPLKGKRILRKESGELPKTPYGKYLGVKL